MSKKRRRQYLKTRFKDGDRPNGNDFAELIESSLNQKSDQIFAVDQMLGIGTKEPGAPLEVNGSRKSQKQSVVVTDGANSTFKIAHPKNKVVAIGSALGESMQLGSFNDQNDNFIPQMYITKGRVGIGTRAEKAELDVKTTLWVGESIGLGEGTLYFKNDKLYLKTDKHTYVILTRKSHDGKPFRKLILLLIIFGCIFFALGIILIILYLINKN